MIHILALWLTASILPAIAAGKFLHARDHAAQQGSDRGGLSFHTEQF